MHDNNTEEKEKGNSRSSLKLSYINILAIATFDASKLKELIDTESKIIYMYSPCLGTKATTN